MNVGACSFHHQFLYTEFHTAVPRTSVRARLLNETEASIARTQVWLGLPIGRFQSGGTCRIAAAMARW